jgi:hypothetical protein
LVENSYHARSQVIEFQDLSAYPTLIALPKNYQVFSVFLMFFVLNSIGKEDNDAS